MNVRAYYNEIDAYAAQWLRNLIAGGHLPEGDVDERSIVDVQSDDLCGYRQCHFFAGIGGWPLALRLAGWPDTRPVWTGSCPCQPFSVAGKRRGAADERHLWPEFARLIRERRPPTVFGEQVASSDALRWWDSVSDDLENSDYACAAFDLCTAGIADTNISQRLFWVATPSREGLAQRIGNAGIQRKAILALKGKAPVSDGAFGGMGSASRERLGKEGETCHRPPQRTADAGAACWLGASELPTETRLREHCGTVVPQQEAARLGFPGSLGRLPRPVEWVSCADGKYRPIEPGSFPLAHGVPARVGRLRAYGNAIFPQVAAEVIAAYAEVCGGMTP